MRLIVLAINVCFAGSFAGVALGQTDPPKNDQRIVSPAVVRSQQEVRETTVPQKSPALQPAPSPPKPEVTKTSPPQKASTSKPALDTNQPGPPPENRIKPNAQTPDDEAAIASTYNNFFTTYRLGPEDVISVTVFNQDRYSRSGIVVPPSGRIALSLVPGGIFVNGKTVEEVAALITKQYDEYIIDPQVTVSLDKAASYHYSVIGDVGQPGVRVMGRRLTVTEALAEAGGVLPTGNRSRVMVLRRQPNGALQSITVNVSAVYKGKEYDNTYLVPGDQIVVPGNKLKTMQKIMAYGSVLSFARIFMGGLPF